MQEQSKRLELHFMTFIAFFGLLMYNINMTLSCYLILSASVDSSKEWCW